MLGALTNAGLKGKGGNLDAETNGGIRGFGVNGVARKLQIESVLAVIGLYWFLSEFRDL